MNSIDSNLENVVELFQKILDNDNVFFQFLDMFPFAIEVFSVDGTSVYVNQVMLENGNIANENEIVGNYNILKDPVCNDVLGLRECIQKAFKGECVLATDVRTPYEDTGARYLKKDESFSKVSFQDISMFPILDKQKQVIYVVAVFYIKQSYKEKKEIVYAREYINKNWLEKFNLHDVAKVAELSTSQLSRLFKQYMGMTPHEYYKHVKISKIKEKLCDPNMSIVNVFYSCGVDYHSKYRQFFKDIVGLTPSEYRKEKLRTKK